YPVDSGHGKVVDIDWLQSISPGTINTEYGQAPQSPGNVVDQDILLSEQHCRPEDGVRNTDLLKVVLYLCLAAEVGKRRVAIRISNADVDDATNARAFGSVQDNFRVGDCLCKGEMRGIVEPYPIGIHQNVDPAQRVF